MTASLSIDEIKNSISSILKNEPLLSGESQEDRNKVIADFESASSDTNTHTKEYLTKLQLSVEQKYKKFREFQHVRTLGFAQLEVLKPVYDEKEHNFVLGPVGEVRMNGPYITIGKDETCNVCLSEVGKDKNTAIPDSTLRFISKVHCTISYDEMTGTFYLINNSKNGTLVDGFLVTTEPYVLSGSVSQRPRGPLDELPLDSVNEIRIGEILLGKDPLFFTINTCVIRIHPLDIKPEFSDEKQTQE